MNAIRDWRKANNITTEPQRDSGNDAAESSQAELDKLIAQGRARISFVADRNGEVTLDELLAWYVGPDDYIDLAGFTYEQIEQSIRFYITDRDYNSTQANSQQTQTREKPTHDDIDPTPAR